MASNKNRCVERQAHGAMAELERTNVRRLAEVHFDMIIPLQFDDRVPEALSHCRSAQKLMRMAKDEGSKKGCVLEALSHS
eukprot:scaffold81483_cov15-Tisochrysis_lutea.AAC.1